MIDYREIRRKEAVGVVDATSAVIADVVAVVVVDRTFDMIANYEARWRRRKGRSLL